MSRHTLSPQEGLTDEDFQEAAERLGCEVAAIRAVAEVESPRAAFLDYRPDGRGGETYRVPTCLFERHKFYEYVCERRGAPVGNAWYSDHPNLCNPNYGGYEGGAAEHDRLGAAADLDRTCALLSASYGRFQVMGFNWQALEYDSLQAFINAMWGSEAGHLDAFVRFVEANGLGQALRNLDWRVFARGYNGRGYERNDYHIRMRDAYRKHASAT
jgi:hypothetical protein